MSQKISEQLLDAFDVLSDPLEAERLPQRAGRMAPADRVVDPLVHQLLLLLLHFQFLLQSDLSFLSWLSTALNAGASDCFVRVLEVVLRGVRDRPEGLSCSPACKGHNHIHSLGGRSNRGHHRRTVRVYQAKFSDRRVLDVRPYLALARWSHQMDLSC